MKVINVGIVGASGYSGIETAAILHKNSFVNLQYLWVSEGSELANQPVASVYPNYQHYFAKQSFVPLVLSNAEKQAESLDAVFLATPHEVSYHLADWFIQRGVKVFDISGAFRLKDAEDYSRYYGFEHQKSELLASACYGLAEWNKPCDAEHQLIAVPGCYPTAASLALKPLVECQLINPAFKPIINATSGVSGAGKKASSKTHFCEVSLQPYGIFNHRHLPEIQQASGVDVVFTPHLGNFKRGILMTVTAKLADDVSYEDVTACFKQFYQDKPLVRLCNSAPAVEQVVNSSFCDLFWQVNDGYIIVVSAIDNLLKGAAGQAVQCFNLCYGLPETEGLV